MTSYCIGTQFFGKTDFEIYYRDMVFYISKPCSLYSETSYLIKRLKRGAKTFWSRVHNCGCSIVKQWEFQQWTGFNSLMFLRFTYVQGQKHASRCPKFRDSAGCMSNDLDQYDIIDRINAGTSRIAVSCCIRSDATGTRCGINFLKGVYTSKRNLRFHCWTTYSQENLAKIWITSKFSKSPFLYVSIHI